MEEIWKDIPGYEGYQVSNFGRVRSCRKVLSDGTTFFTSNSGEWKVLNNYTEILSSGYIRIVSKIRKLGAKSHQKFSTSRLVWQAFNGLIPDDKVIDHIDRNPTNNFIENLRLCTKAQNSQNRKKHSNSKQKFRGVSFDPKKKLYRASIQCNNKKINLGRFKKEIDAAKKYNEAALLYHGEFANLNIIPSEVN